MKKILTILLTLILGTNLIFAQNVGINTDGSTPETSAMLDVKSTAKGFLAPRMTAAQKAAITSPATGLLVYQTDASAGYYYNSGTPASPLWVQLGAASGASQWATAGSDIYFNTGNVGIGTTSPTTKLDVSGEVNFSENLTITKNIKWANSGYGIQLSFATVGPKDALVSRSASGSQWVDVGSDAAWSGVTLAANGGNVGIGTTTPLSKISAVNNNFDATTNPGYKFYGFQSSTSATVPLFHIQSGWENNLAANVFKVNTYQNEAGFNILCNGNVGIGTTSPQAKLQVDGRVIINYAAAPGFYGQSAGANKVYLGYDGAGTGLELYNFTSGRSLMVRDNGDLTYLGNVGIGTTTPADLLQVGNLMFGGNSGREIYSTSGYDINYKATGASSHHFYANGTEIFTIDKTGNIGIGVNSPSQPLHMSSGAHVTTAGVWTNASDARLKTNVVNTTYGLQTVMQLRPVNYNMIKGGEAQVGFIAQEVQKIVPEVVSGTEGDITKGETLGLSYGNLVPVLTKAIQEQQATIEAQQKQIDELKAQNTALAGELKAEIESLKKAINGSSGIVNSEK